MAVTRARRRLVFDGFGTLWGYVASDEDTLLLRPHAQEVLSALAGEYDLALWTTAPRARLDPIIALFPFLADLFSEMITLETAPVTADTFITPQPRVDRISKNVNLIGGAVLIDDSEAALREGAAFGFPVLRPPGYYGDTPADLPRLAADNWLLGLPALLARLWEAPPAPNADHRAAPAPP